MNLARKLSAIWLTVWVGLASFVTLLWGTPEFHLEQSLRRPSLVSGFLGADAYGRSLLHLVTAASLRSLLFSIACVSISVVIAISVAAVSPSLPKWLYRLIESCLEFFLSFPSIFIALTIAGYLGPGHITLALGLLIGMTPGLTRSLWVRSREVAQLDFIQAAHSLGASAFRIGLKHHLPFLYSMVRVKIPSLLSHAIIAEASLSFLGLGFPSGEESWGSLLGQAKDYLIEAPHLSMVIGFPLLLSLMALDIISKKTDPKVV